MMEVQLVQIDLKISSIIEDDLAGFNMNYECREKGGVERCILGRQQRRKAYAARRNQRRVGKND